MIDKIIEIFTDGACSGNPGPGGWGAIIRTAETETEISGGETETTNNRMEMLAAINALERLSSSATIHLYTDSQYLKQGIETWLEGWKRKNWKTASGKPVKNQELWQRLDSLNQKHDIKFIWVKGHAGHEENERADILARNAIPKI